MPNCPKCEAVNIGTNYCPLCEPEKMPNIVGKMDTSDANFGQTKKGYAVARDSVYVKEIWNEAIEAAALIAADYQSDKAATAIRKLKK